MAALILLGLSGCASKQEAQPKPSGLHKVEFPAPTVPDFDHDGRLVLARATSATRCGVERWSIKTLADPAGQELLAHPDTIVATTLGQLVAEPAPTRAQLLRAKATRWPQEKVLYQIEAELVGYKREADGDYHLVLRDVVDGQTTMVAEIPASVCFVGGGLWESQKEFAAAFGQPAKQFKTFAPIKVRVVGVGFFDFIHGQTGVAANGFELHPLFSITRSALLQ